LQEKIMSELDAIRVLNRNETIRTLGLSDRTWDRLEAAGDTPPKTRISQGRIGYRVSDLKAWLDRRREMEAVA
jgi:predicted DNA-binding transcriptional regulator AlpA